MLGFRGELDKGDAQRALELADQAKDDARSRTALWALLEAGFSPPHAQRLIASLKSERSAEGAMRLAALCEKKGAPQLAARLYDDVGFGAVDGAVNPAALLRLLELEPSEELVQRLLSVVGDESPPALVDRLLEWLSVLDFQARANALEKAAAVLPKRARSLARDLYELCRNEGALPRAARALNKLLELTEDAQPRSALGV